MRSIRWKMMLASFLIVIIPVYAINRYAVLSFDRFTRKALEEEMIGHAFMIGELYKAMVLDARDMRTSDGSQNLASLMISYGRELNARLRILSPQGRVLYDSAVDSSTGKDMSSKREVSKAMQGKYGSAWELTPDRRLVYFYSAVPIHAGDQVAGIAHVARHTGQITRAIIIMVQDQRVAMLVAVVFACLVSAVLAHAMTRRMRSLTRSTIAYARGDAPLDLRITGNDEIGELGRAVSFMAEEIETRNAYNRNFVSTVMHELKTPITAIKGAAEVLEGGAIDDMETRTKFLGNIRFEADRMTRMVGELNELTKLDIEDLRGQKESVDYCACLKEILDRIVPTFEDPHATFSVAMPDESITTLILPGRIEQVVANLLENAFRYTPSTGRVDLVVTRNADHVHTAIRDTGPGIPASVLESVFDRFYTTERKDVPREFGSGLGLAIARSIIDNHQGRIWAESAPGEGACFTFSLPIS